MDLKQQLSAVLAQKGKTLESCTDQDLYYALLTVTQKVQTGSGPARTGRKLYYISAEFLIGKLLSNNLLGGPMNRKIIPLFEEYQRSNDSVQEGK